MYTNAEIFDGNDTADFAEFHDRVKHWDGQPDDAECDDEFDDEEPFDHLLAQQELEDFEQADEYFGGYGDADF